jgi:hypothetical protein
MDENLALFQVDLLFCKFESARYTYARLRRDIPFASMEIKKALRMDFSTLQSTSKAV